MARPRELYNTPAPQAMSMMGQGIADAYANAGRIEGQGMMAMGQGIAQGITSAASAVAGYMKEAKQLESQNKSYENLLKNSLVQNMLFKDKQGPEGVITAKDQASQFIAQTADMKPSEKNMVYNMIVPPAIGQYHKMQQIEAEQGGAMNRAMVGVGPQYAQLEEQRKQRLAEQERYKGVNAKIDEFRSSLGSFRGMFSQ
jgi:hypothetical protein